MMTLHRYEVQPSIPAELEPLTALAQNLWWSWNESARDLFARIDPELYERVSENPIATLLRASQERLDALAADAGYLAELGRIRGELAAYLGRETWFDRAYGKSPLGASTIAYFSMEFGVHESVPVYSGGLGVLAGDHLKSASDLGLPLVGVGVAFSQGYFRQSLDHEGWQTERYPPNDWHDLPVSPVNDAAGAARHRLRHAPRARRAVERREQGPHGLPPGLARRRGAHPALPPRRQPAPTTRPRIARSPTPSTAAIATTASARRSSSAWAACASSGPSACSRPSAT